MNKDQWLCLKTVTDKLEATFKDPTFKGRFRMQDFGLHAGQDHPAEEKNFCGTAACVAGWFAILDKDFGEENFSWVKGVMRPGRLVDKNTKERYGLDMDAQDFLFYTGYDKSLKEKINDIREILEAQKPEELP